MGSGSDAGQSKPGRAQKEIGLEGGKGGTVGNAPPRSPQSVPPVALPTLRQTSSADSVPRRSTRRHLRQSSRRLIPTPPSTSPRILTSKTVLEGERKQVTVLFADLKGSMELLADRDPEEARKILDSCARDGIMALFGAPLAHEDHAVRACYAALRMQESVKTSADEARRSRRRWGRSRRRPILILPRSVSVDATHQGPHVGGPVIAIVEVGD